MRSRWVLLITVVVLSLTGCATIPTSGPVEAGTRPSEAPTLGVEVAPQPPRPGASPGVVVDGFLQAMTNYQPGYVVAREYLASDVREAWQPEAGITIYADGHGVRSRSDGASLTAPLVGRVGPDGAFSHDTGTLVHDFGLVRENGEWRISNPQPGLLMSRYLFETFYSSVNTYYFDPSWRRLVPDPIFLPVGNKTPTALLQALLRGPTAWLRPAVVSAIPAQTRLNVRSASMDADGVVEVSLNDSVSALAEDQRSRLAGQIVWTLRQVDGVSGVRILVDGSPFVVPETHDGVVPTDAFPSLNPIPQNSSGHMVGVTEGGVVSVDGNAGILLPLNGELGRTPGIRSLAVDSQGSRIAAVADGVRVFEGTSDGPASEVLTGTGILRPQYVSGRGLELWVIADEGAHQVLHRLGREGVVSTVVPGSDSARIRAFQVSPEGTRMAMIREEAGGDELGLVRVVRRGDEVTLDGWRPVPVHDVLAEGTRHLVDVGWSDATNLIALGSEDRQKPVKPFRLDQDAVQVEDIGQAEASEALSLAVGTRQGSRRAVIIGRENSWRYLDDYRWSRLPDGLVAVAFAN